MTSHAASRVSAAYDAMLWRCTSNICGTYRYTEKDEDDQLCDEPMHRASGAARLMYRAGIYELLEEPA